MEQPTNRWPRGFLLVAVLLAALILVPVSWWLFGALFGGMMGGGMMGGGMTGGGMMGGMSGMHGAGWLGFLLFYGLLLALAIVLVRGFSRGSRPS